MHYHYGKEEDNPTQKHSKSSGRRASLRGFHLPQNALGEDLYLLLFSFQLLCCCLETCPGGNSGLQLGGHWSMALCTFPFRFRVQCNSNPVLVEEKGPKMPDGHFVALLELTGKNTLPQEGAQQHSTGGTVWRGCNILTRNSSFR